MANQFCEIENEKIWTRIIGVQNRRLTNVPSCPTTEQSYNILIFVISEQRAFDIFVETRFHRNLDFRKNLETSFTDDSGAAATRSGSKFNYNRCWWPARLEKSNILQASLQVQPFKKQPFNPPTHQLLGWVHVEDASQIQSSK